MDTQKQRVTVHSTADLIASIPHLIGYSPSDAVVMLGLRDGIVTLTAVSQIDAAPGPEAMARESARVIGQHADDILLVAFDSEPGRTAPLVKALWSAVAEHPTLQTRQTLVVHGHEWVQADPDGSVGPTQPLLPLDPEAQDQFAEAGARPRSDSRQGLLDLFAPSPDVAALPPAGEVDFATAYTGLAAWRSVLHDGTIDATAVPLLAMSVSNIAFRDSIVGAITGNLPAEVIVDLEEGVDLVKVKAVYAALEEQLTPKQMVALMDTVQRLAPATPTQPEAANLLCVFANLIYMVVGDGLIARTLNDRALAADPTLRLAILTDRLMDLAVRPSTRYTN